MPTTARPQQRYDHRLRNLVQRTTDITVATDLVLCENSAHGGYAAAVVELQQAGSRSPHFVWPVPITEMFGAINVLPRPWCGRSS